MQSAIWVWLESINVVFVGRRWFGQRKAVIPMSELKEPVWRSGLLMNQWILPGKKTAESVKKGASIGVPAF